MWNQCISGIFCARRKGQCEIIFHRRRPIWWWQTAQWSMATIAILKVSSCWHTHYLVDIHARALTYPYPPTYPSTQPPLPTHSRMVLPLNSFVLSDTKPSIVATICASNGWRPPSLHRSASTGAGRTDALAWRQSDAPEGAPCPRPTTKLASHTENCPASWPPWP